MATSPSHPHYIDRGGRIACREHLGAYGKAHIEAHPLATSFDTPLTNWQRMTAREKFEVVTSEWAGGVLCESCRMDSLGVICL